jgi:flagellar hook-associated protein 2
MAASFGGLVSGLDTQSIVTQLMAIERRPLTVLQTKKSTQNKLLSIYSDASTKLAAIRSAAQGLDTVRGFRKVKATSADDEIFTASASSAANPGNHAIKVMRLAQAEMEVSQGYATVNDSVGQGTFSFTLDGAAAFSVTTTSDMTLAGLRDAINASDAEVSATILNDGDPASPYRLVITADDTGKAIAFTSNFTGGTPPAFTDGANPGDPGQKAQTAQVIVDGVTTTRQSNVIDDLLDGVTITLKKPDTTASYALTVESNAEEIVGKVKEFVEKFNDFHSYVVAKKADGSLKSDSVLESFDRELRGVVTAGVPGLETATYRAISQVGVTFSREGVMALDETEFGDALEADFDGVMKLFASVGSTSGTDVSVNAIGDATKAGTYAYAVTGVGDAFAATINGHAATTYSGSYFTGADGQPEAGLSLRFIGNAPTTGTVTVTIGLMELIDRKIKTYVDSADGRITGRKNAINASIRSIDSQIDRKQKSLERTEARLNRQFNQMEQLVSKMQTQGGFLSAARF